MYCKNCNTTLNDHSRFCSNCGERINAKRLKVSSIIALFFSNFFSVDNKFTKTFKDLTIKPEKVIDSYVNGYRKNYINVIGYLGFAITLIGFQFFVLRRFFPELLVVDSPQNSEALKVNNEIFDMNVFMDSYYQYQGLATILFIPLYAFASKLIFSNFQKYNLAEHFVINIYTIAHFFIIWFVFAFITLPLSINYNILSSFLIIPMLIYMTYTFKRLYDINTLNSFGRTFLYYLIAFIATMGIIFVFAIGYGIYLAYSVQITTV